MLVKFKYAKCENQIILNGCNSLADDLDESIDQNKVIMPRISVKDNKLENEAKRIKFSYSEKICRSLPSNAKLVYISSVVSPNEIWVQEKFNLSENLDVLQTKLVSHYSNCINDKNCLENVWKVGDMCVFKNSKKMEFYRGKIVDAIGNDKFKVICLDNGQYNDNVSPTCMFHLTDEFKSLDFLSTKCCLYGVVPTGSGTGEWGNLATTYVCDLLQDTSVSCVFMQNEESQEPYEIDIYINTSPKKENELYPTATMFEEFIKFSDLVTLKGFALLKKTQEQLRSQLFRLKTYKLAPVNLDPHGEYTFVLHVDKRHISCVSKKNEPALRQFEKELNAYYQYTIKQIKLNRFQNKQACILKKTTNGKTSFHRAKIVIMNDFESKHPSLSDDKVRVMKIDEGKYEIVNKADLYEPVREHLDLPAYIINLNLLEYFDNNGINFIKTSRLERLLITKKQCLVVFNPSISENDLYSFKEIFRSDLAGPYCLLSNCLKNYALACDDLPYLSDDEAPSCVPHLEKYKMTSFEFNPNHFYPIEVGEVATLTKVTKFQNKLLSF
jgi:hypothetical protein